TAPLIIFQTLQCINWYLLLSRRNIKIISWLNFPYLLYALFATFILIYFFWSTNILSLSSMLEDVASIALDMFIWVCTIICLGRTKNNVIALLALGCLMIVSADLTFTCIFMFEMNSLISTVWPHFIWAMGALLMA